MGVLRTHHSSGHLLLCQSMCNQMTFTMKDGQQGDDMYCEKRWSLARYAALHTHKHNRSFKPPPT